MEKGVTTERMFTAMSHSRISTLPYRAAFVLIILYVSITIRIHQITFKVLRHNFKKNKHF